MKNKITLLAALILISCAFAFSADMVVNNGYDPGAMRTDGTNADSPVFPGPVTVTGALSAGSVQGATQVASATALAAHADATGLNVHGMNATGTASITVTLLNCHATGTFIIPTVAPTTPLAGMIWFEP